MERRRDSANLFVLESIIIAMVLLGAAYAVSSLRGSSLENVRPRTELERVTTDVLTVLAWLDDGNKTPLLDVHLLEALHCAKDQPASTLDCHGTRSKNLSIKLDNYLPLGGGYALGLGNGVATREIYVSPLPQGEAVSSSRGFAPSWNTSFVYADFSCYPAGVDIHATLIPIDRGRVVATTSAKVKVAEREYAAVASGIPKWYDVTVNDPRPAAGDVRASAALGSITFPGLTAYTQCSHNGRSAELKTALDAVTFSADAASVPVASTLGFEADLAAIEALPGVVVDGATVTVYEPLPTRINGADTWIQAGGAMALTNGPGARTATWTAPADSLYGTHPALLRISARVDGNPVEMRRVVLVDVALHTGEVPIDAPYRAVLRTWLADWR